LSVMPPSSAIWLVHPAGWGFLTLNTGHKPLIWWVNQANAVGRGGG
jgi:hypothetical protein